MTTLDALFAAVLHDPDCDAARLVYADALEETGEEFDVARAKLIRWQIETGKTATAQMTAGALAAHFPDDAPAAVRPALLQIATGVEADIVATVSRGFVSEVRMTAIAVASFTPDLVAPVADRLSSAVAGLFDGNPVERIVLDLRDPPRPAGRGDSIRETGWDVVRVVSSPSLTWWHLCRDFNVGGSAFWEDDRAAFARQLGPTVRERLLAHGRHLFRVQDANIESDEVFDFDEM